MVAGGEEFDCIAEGAVRPTLWIISPVVSCASRYCPRPNFVVRERKGLRWIVLALAS